MLIKIKKEKDKLQVIEMFTIFWYCKQVNNKGSD